MGDGVWRDRVLGQGAQHPLSVSPTSRWVMGSLTHFVRIRSESEDGTPRDDTVRREAAPPVGDPGRADHEAGNQESRRGIGHEQNVRNDHQGDESEQLEHWFDTVG